MIFEEAVLSRGDSTEDDFEEDVMFLKYASFRTTFFLKKRKREFHSCTTPPRKQFI